MVEHTNSPQFLLFFQVHTPKTTAFMVWDLDRNRAKWKELAPGVICDETYTIQRLRFGNALMGYLSNVSDNGQVKYSYVFRDLSTGNVVRTFNLDRYRDPDLSSEFGCAFTSFVFIAWQPQEILDSYFQSEPNTNVFASFDIYSLSSGQQIYTLQCPMNYPIGFDVPIIPRFQRTDESERYWLFPCSDVFMEEDRVNSVCVWDVVLQQWTLLGSLCVEDGASPYVYETEDGFMKMASVDLNSLHTEWTKQEEVLARFRWKRLPTVKEAMKLNV